ncbi:MAG: acyloxyacyl hydrolase [Candidatus Omnitrophota bacterium]
MERHRSFLIILSVLIFLASGACLAEEAPQKTLTGIEVLTGFGWSNIKGQSNYNTVPFSVAFDLDLKKLAQKINFSPPQLLQFQIEPFIGLISNPKSNFETGVNFWLKMGFTPETWKFQPYIKLGAGLDYMTLHLREQGTQFNFVEYGALGMHHYFNANTALTVEGRWRHLSNCGIREPNDGINAYFLLTGISYKY